MPRLREALRRPEKISIRQGIVTCHYRRGRCFYTSGPHLTRDLAVLAAQEHYERCHHKPRSTP